MKMKKENGNTAGRFTDISWDDLVGKPPCYGTTVFGWPYFITETMFAGNLKWALN